MTDYKYYEASPHEIQSKALWPMILGVLLVATSFLLPPYGGAAWVQQYGELTAPVIALSDSVKTAGAGLITVLCVALLATRRRLSSQYRIKEAVALIGAVIIFAAGGAMVNENTIKPIFESPRPNVVWLATQQASSEAGFSVDAYHARELATDRARFMQSAINALGTDVPKAIGQHWVSEPGYSLPSGHAFASFFIATFFVFFATSFVSTRRHLLFYLLIPWAVMVSYSRVFLNAHRPLDVTLGAIQGLAIGILAWLVARWIVRKLVHSEIGA
ncbi:MAG: phosphatase PAP2 family protein [Pseudomonadota bacterium]